MSSFALVGTIGAMLIVAAVFAWVLAPLVLGAAATPSDDPRILALLLERESALAEIRDLDEARSAGRIQSDDHADRRQAALERGAAALRALDKVASEQGASSARYAAKVEKELARRVGYETERPAAEERSL